MKGAAKKKVTPNQLRHSDIGKYPHRLSTKASRVCYDAYTSTTLAYLRIPDELVIDEIDQTIRSQLDQIKGKPTEGENK